MMSIAKFKQLYRFVHYGLNSYVLTERKKNFSEPFDLYPNAYGFASSFPCLCKKIKDLEKNFKCSFLNTLHYKTNFEIAAYRKSNSEINIKNNSNYYFFMIIIQEIDANYEFLNKKKFIFDYLHCLNYFKETIKKGNKINENDFYNYIKALPYETT